MTMKVLLTLFLILVLTSCSGNAGKPNNSPQISTPTALITATSALIATPTALITATSALIATPTTLIATPTTTQIMIPATCLQHADTSEWSAKIASSCITTQAREEIIRILVAVWLNHFTSTNVSEEIRLEKFTIDSITMGGSLNLPNWYKADFIAALRYSVKPTIAHSSRWIAGDGIVGDDGWVRDKRNYVGIINTSDLYEIKIWGYYLP